MSLMIFCLLHLPIPDREVLKSLTVVVDCSSFPCSSITFCLKLFDVLVFDAYTLRIAILSWRTDPFLLV